MHGDWMMMTHYVSSLLNTQEAYRAQQRTASSEIAWNVYDSSYG